VTLNAYRTRSTRAARLSVESLSRFLMRTSIFPPVCVPWRSVHMLSTAHDQDQKHDNKTRAADESNQSNVVHVCLLFLRLTQELCQAFPECDRRWPESHYEYGREDEEQQRKNKFHRCLGSLLFSSLPP